MRLVVDTNVLVSGLLSPFGPPGVIVQLIAAGRVRLCYDTRVFAEYAEVLRRPAFPFGEAQATALLSAVATTGELTSATPLAAQLPDPTDAPFLEVAIAASAEYLVTGNTKHFPPAHRYGTRVVTPRELLEHGFRSD